MKAIVVGAGIGGLAVGLAMKRIGWTVMVCDPGIRHVPDITSITLWSNAMAALRDLGVEEGVLPRSHVLRAVHIRSREGRVLARFDAKELEGKRGAMSVCITRADLMDVLLGALGRDVVVPGMTIADLRQDDGGVTVRFESGDALRADVLIGADGPGSAIRAVVDGEGVARYAGYNLWIGLTGYAHALLPHELAFESWGSGLRFGAMHTSGRQVSWYVARNEQRPASQGTIPEKALLRGLFRTWHQPIGEIIGSTPVGSIFRHAVYRQVPAARWSVGRITLAGSAAHPMTSEFGQGAGIAIEDAVELARWLDSGLDIPTALWRYERARLPRAGRIARFTRGIGRFVQTGSTMGVVTRNLIARALPERAAVSLLRGMLKTSFGSQPLGKPLANLTIPPGSPTPTITP